MVELFNQASALNAMKANFLDAGTVMTGTLSSARRRISLQPQYTRQQQEECLVSEDAFVAVALNPLPPAGVQEKEILPVPRARTDGARDDANAFVTRRAYVQVRI